MKTFYLFAINKYLYFLPFSTGIFLGSKSNLYYQQRRCFLVEIRIRLRGYELDLCQALSNSARLLMSQIVLHLCKTNTNLTQYPAIPVMAETPGKE